MGQICVLPASLVNKIAAGEVVERPASVFKELLENSLDAGASRIDATIEDGGKKLVRVVDDGAGIRQEDMPLVAASHATSKLQCEQDLYCIATLGFRGEALASIGAVSHLRIASRPRDADAGCEITVAGEDVCEPRAVACPAGTTVEVRNLFFNVAARRKFLRTRSTELGHVTEQLARVAVAHPGVAFTMSHDGRVLHRLPATSTVVSRIGDFYGGELADALVPVRRQEGDVAIEGYVALPVHSRATARWQYTFLNGRYIRDRYLQHAIKEAYRGLVDPSRFPVVFLFLRLPPDAVDVNVHPTKIEVRWRDSNVVHSQVLAALRDTFLESDLTAPLKPPGESDPAEEERRRQTRQAIADYFKQVEPVQSRLRFDAGAPGQAFLTRARSSGPERFGTPSTAGESGTAQTPRAAHEPDLPAEARPGGTVEEVGSPAVGEAGLETPPVRHARPDRICEEDRPRAIQLHNTYLVAESADGLIIVDQHALHERILYEQLWQRLERGPLESQRLLLPETLNVTAQQIAVLDSQADLLARLGFELTPFGRDTVAVQAIPAILEDADARGLARDLIDKLTERSGESSGEAFVHEVLDMMACKAAVKAGCPLSPQEIEALLAQRDLVERRSSCPHGRPTALRLSMHDLEKQFKRT